MNDDLKVGKLVFNSSGDIVFAGEGTLSPNPLEYAPQGTIKELAALKIRLKVRTAECQAYFSEMVNRGDEVDVLKGLIREVIPKLQCQCPHVVATANGEAVPVITECSVCALRNRPEVKKIMGEEK